MISIKRAVPFKIQYDCCFADGSKTATTKFVLCPVVDNTPALTAVLYRGETYLGSFFGSSNTGFMCKTGSDGCISPKVNHLIYYSKQCIVLKTLYKVLYLYLHLPKA